MYIDRESDRFKWLVRRRLNSWVNNDNNNNNNNNNNNINKSRH